MIRYKNIYLIGPMGAGKTSIGKLLADKLEREFVDCDQEIINRTGASIDLIFEIEGEKGFRKRESQVLEDIAQGSGKIISTGGGVVLDANNRKLLKSSGYVIYLQSTPELLHQRTKHDRTRPLLETDDRLGKIKEILNTRAPLYRETADFVVNTEINSVRKITNLLYNRLIADE